MIALSLCLGAGVVAGALAGTAPQDRAAPLPAGPETIAVIATATATGQGAAAGTVTVPVTIQIDRYTPDHARAPMVDGLKYNGYPGFLRALREAPAAGYLEVGGQKFTIRWAHQERADGSRTISLVTDTPVYFVGGGRPGAKPTKGFEVAVVLLTLNDSGGGEGTMAAAARVKPRGTTGVQIDDYAETPLKLTVAKGRK